jgi:hypothetical protein
MRSMPMQLISMIRFNDADMGDEALVTVRAGEGVIALTLALDGVGEVEVIFGPEEYARLRAALEQAAAVARES